MSISIHSKHGPCRMRRLRQGGVVLIVALIMLVVISLLATFSIRNATSTEAVSGNVRTTQLATQAAEIALRYCEAAVQAVPMVVTPLAYQATPYWQDMANWDGATSVANARILIIPASVVGGTATYRRPPECMMEHVQVFNSDNTVNVTSTYVITARGFGPEVAAVDPVVRARPAGSEVWLQSTIELEE